MASVEQAIRAAVVPGTRLPTPSGRAMFEVSALERSAIVLLFGEKRARTGFRIRCSLRSSRVCEGVVGSLWAPSTQPSRGRVPLRRLLSPR
jgi:hypothetical protein